MLNSLTKLFLPVVLIGLFSGPALAMDPAQVPEKKRTTLGLYYSAVEAAAFMKDNGKHALFLDVRDPHELQTTGMASPVDYNLPFYFINTDKWDDKKSRFAFEQNPDFVAQVKQRFEAKGLSGFDAIIVMCAGGTRAADAVDVLAKAGYRNVTSVVDGYNGWRNNELDWNKKLVRAKMYGKIASGQ